ncbi:SoxR reducing system RseC family protein [Endozoicomonadaceae bacterium StTr2]
MLEETGKVISVEGRNVWVETVRQSSCGSCASGKVCGHKLLEQRAERKAVEQKLNFVQARLSDDFSHPELLAPGDQVSIGMPEQSLLQAALTTYLLPLLLFFTSLIVSHLLGLAEPYQIVAAIGGLSAGLLLMRRAGQYLSQFTDLQPVVLNVLRDETPVRILTPNSGLSAG